MLLCLRHPVCLDVRHMARSEVHRGLTDGLSPDQWRQMDALTTRRGETSQSSLAWLRGMPE
ncbi:hypothetical protein LPC08_21115 [Roseomonas sp. OT10]|uniref:hypothetical protein n=1 Tax=Roseomonas cutis TaxID=2897332 RepID=UPI001E358068|nr:hypothetical protein [Roseomonas sp. OT10]UFN48487.1 hypothetical protein LPC08_21115 [Roseomonas sp. OT10]